MRSRIVKVVKYFFDNGNLTLDQIKRYVVVGTLTVDDYKAITGEDYVAEHLEANEEANDNDNENENEESSSEPSNETEAKEANENENEESSSQPAQ